MINPYEADKGAHEKASPQFEKGKPVWYVNKRTKKVYAGVYYGSMKIYGVHRCLVYTPFGAARIVAEDVFDTKSEAMQHLYQYLYNLWLTYKGRLSLLSARINSEYLKKGHPTDKENEAYKRLYARYLEWAGERSR